MSIRTTLVQSSLLRHLVITSTKERNMEIAEVIFLTLLNIYYYGNNDFETDTGGDNESAAF